MTISSLLIICIVGPGCCLCCYLLKEKIALGKENQCNEKTNKTSRVFSPTAFENVHKGRQNINSEKGASRIPLTRNSAFLEPPTCVRIFGHLGPAFRLRWKQGSAHSPLLTQSAWTRKVGQPHLKARLASSNSKQQPYTKAMACIFSESAWRVKREQGC